MTNRTTRRGVLTLGVLLLSLALVFGYRVQSAGAMPVELPGGSLDWSVKDSFVAYIEGNIAKGEVILDGATENADGSFAFPLVQGTTDTATGETAATFGGSVRFTGHDEGTGPQLDLLFRNIRVEVSGVAGSLVADVTSKGLGETDATEYPGVIFATLDFSATPPSLAQGSLTFTGVPATLTADGAEAFAGFYDEGEQLDPVSLTFQLPGTPPAGTVTPPSTTTTAEPSPTTTPVAVDVKLSLSKTTVDPDGDTITVTGSGFLPELSIGTRPPLANQPAGFYVAFGSFADDWRPSQGAGASARPAYGQADGGIKWILSEAGRDIVGRDDSATLNADGTFTATIKVKRGYDGAHPDGNYGIYTYPGSGAVQPAFETFTPLEFTGVPQPPATGTGLAGDTGNTAWLLALLGAAIAGGGALTAIALRK